MILRSLYTLLLCLFSPFLLLGLYKNKPNKPKFGARWKEHFGITPPLKNQSGQPIWIHTVSVGETIAATPFITALKNKYPDTPIVITTTTSTGAEQAKKLSGIAEHRYMPLDLPFAISGFLNVIKPKMMLIMETELWPNTIHLVSKRNIPITVINARLSARSAQRYAKIQSVFNLLSNGLSTILCQHENDANRFQSLGVDVQKLNVTGSLKFDITIPSSVISNGNKLRDTINQDQPKLRPVWIAASTHQGEDEIILQAHQQLLMTQPDALLILVPRHPERFDRVYSLCQSTDLITARRANNDSLSNNTQVYLADTMGEMLLLIQAADICFMGGSLLGDKVGGHNLLEPAALGKAILTGPSYYNFKDITNTLINNNSVAIINDAQELYSSLNTLFSNLNSAKNKGRVAQDYVEQNKGSIAKTLNLIEHWIPIR
ncbi:3-deoxy-D-manno-octulosonic acid transferase [Vibrio sp. S11_S32]|uniref:lipid IV(A) 3-deoxy-D-manno-octulosonic acid transferase n=1 Tax=Vibrio sp. S11_S32 TaxID=2720225 RepID=UPI0016811460|nr:lipid IV(A) 3-deoxy-D-manno-octulosonic acid transferase [Vibrio sp. S11_S32]MBD1576848.1 3-deoxy-D-manno-octulosonic acid transferase [Vibrio sp. S11_S32]